MTDPTLEMLTQRRCPLARLRLDSRATWEDTAMPSREESAASNLRQAIRDAKGDFVAELTRRGEGGYFALFRKGEVVHRESQIDAFVLEDGPATDAIRKLVDKVKAVFGERQ